MTEGEKAQLKNAAFSVFRGACQRELKFWEAVVAFDKDAMSPSQYVAYLPNAGSRALYQQMFTNVNQLYNHAKTDLLNAKQAAAASHVKEDKTVIQFTEGAFYITTTKRPEDAEPGEPPAVKRQRKVEII